ncbi:ribosome biogenesis GTPase A [Paucilactobacillus hokkaidonensis JCM 18461]|uniref:Ribosome biogenesis GTPase A n=2 Tax=Paucilactobacillus hokkaidonensis TaxID=1193095 RepID=A0A0A1GYX7_9LACO|nr:ribosome biogenesis GTPase YlqF [Paucilactobacillus hokkaidonensis]KRO10674.1 GTP-binding protein YlqF [Paucilactobacillus hokkaidonensis]BAP85666.1 ribosome biogenesis GTPase A [Paucilactobacillus hokkaidonensis JCM 18461]
MAVIQWFPGHMAKALRQIREQMSLIDIVFELIDARIPWSSQNPEVKKAMGDKPHLLILTKLDLADPQVTTQWLKFFEQQNQPVLALDSRENKVRSKITKKSQAVLQNQLVKDDAKGLRRTAIKAMCVGVPNVGKSTLLNHLVNKNMALTGNRPGVTTGQQWLRSSNELELLDTPGVLWPKFKDQRTGVKLALTGAIKDSLYPKDDVALFAVHHLRHYNPEMLQTRYHITDAQLEEDIQDADVLLAITSKLGFRDDYDRASERIIFDLRKGKLGQVTLEQPTELTEDSSIG